jgi:hypothetical protein
MFWRLPIVRHVRWLWYRHLVYRNAREWADAGIGLGFPHDSDLEQLRRIKAGEA